MLYKAEEVRKQRINIMGSDLGVLYDALCNEIVWIQFKWIEYVELFGTDENRISLLNKQLQGSFLCDSEGFI